MDAGEWRRLGGWDISLNFRVGLCIYQAGGVLGASDRHRTAPGQLGSQKKKRKKYCGISGLIQTQLLRPRGRVRRVSRPSDLNQTVPDK